MCTFTALFPTKNQRFSTINWVTLDKSVHLSYWVRHYYANWEYKGEQDKVALFKELLKEMHNLEINQQMTSANDSAI